MNNLTDNELIGLILFMVFLTVAGIFIGVGGGKEMAEKSLAEQGIGHYEANPVTGKVSFMIGTNVVNIYR